MEMPKPPLKVRLAFWYAKNKCFPSTSEVLTPSMEKKRIDSLKSGDEILTLEDGKLKTDVFLGYLHTHEGMTSEFMRFTFDALRGETVLPTASTEVLISEYHLIFAKKAGSAEGDFIMSKEVTVGDSLFVSNTWVVIKSVEKIVSLGVFAPLTKSGTLLVDGALVSNYAYHTDHKFVHNCFKPLRALYKVFGASVVDRTIDGVNWYAKSLMKISETIGTNKFAMVEATETEAQKI